MRKTKNWECSYLYISVIQNNDNYHNLARDRASFKTFISIPCIYNFNLLQGKLSTFIVSSQTLDYTLWLINLILSIHFFSLFRMTSQVLPFQNQLHPQVLALGHLTIMPIKLQSQQPPSVSSTINQFTS